MDNIALVHEANSLNYLRHEKPSLLFSQLFPSFDHFIDTLIVAEFKEDVTVCFVFKEVFVFADIGMLHCPVDFNLCLKLCIDSNAINLISEMKVYQNNELITSQSS